MRTTFGQAKAFGINTFVGLATCDDRFTAMVNEAQMRLLNCGRWWGAYKRIRICVVNGCIVWPREVSAIDAISICNETLPIRNAWYEFLADVAPPSLGIGGQCGCDRMNLLDRGTVPLPNNIITEGNVVAIYPSSATDVGKRILIQGIDKNGVEVRTLDGDTWVTGEYVTIASPFAVTVTEWATGGIRGIQKDPSNDSFTLYEYNGVDAPGSLMGTLFPWETNPDYRRTYINNLPEVCCPQPCAPCGPSGDGCDAALADCLSAGLTVTAIARMEFVPVRVDSDWLTIGNLPALKHECRCLYYEDRKEEVLAEAEHQKALKRLREELDTRVGTRERVTANVDVWGTAKFSRISYGFI